MFVVFQVLLSFVFDYDSENCLVNPISDVETPSSLVPGFFSCSLYHNSNYNSSSSFGHFFEFIHFVAAGTSLDNFVFIIFRLFDYADPSHFSKF
jgi:hypothetical protein